MREKCGSRMASGILTHVRASPDRAHLRRQRSDGRRRPAGRPADAREHGLPSAVGGHRAHGAGHARASSRSTRSTPRWVAAGARACSTTCRVDAFKIGVLGSAENIAAIAEILAEHPDIPLVLDPVLASGRGDELATDEMIARAARAMLPQTTIVTPEQHRSAAPRERDDEDAARSRAQRLVEAARIRARHGNARATAARSSTRCTTAAASCAKTAGRGLPGAITARAARSPRRIAATLANGLGLPRRCATRRSSPGRRSQRRSRRHGPAPSRPVLLGARDPPSEC